MKFLQDKILPNPTKSTKKQVVKTCLSGSGGGICIERSGNCRREERQGK